MKRRILKWMPILCLGFLCVGFVSCGDDDDDNAGGVASSAVPSPTLTDANGVPFRVTQFGMWSYTYDSNGKLTKIQEDSGEEEQRVFDLSGSAFVLNWSWADSDDSWSESSSIVLNAQGFVGSFTSTWDDRELDDGEWEKGTEKVSCSYNAEGRLVKYTSTGNYTGNDDGENYSGSWTSESVLTWENGKLTSIVQTWNEVEDGDKDSGTESVTFSYGSKVNTSKQWLRVMGYYVEDGSAPAETVTTCLPPLGLFGYGPDYLPTNYTARYSDDYTYNGTLTYSQNSNGTLSNDNGNYYTYDGVSSSATRAQQDFGQPRDTHMWEIHRGRAHVQRLKLRNNR